VAAPSAVFTIARAAEMLGETVELLGEIAEQLEPEDGCLWIYDTDEAGPVAARRAREASGSHMPRPASPGAAGGRAAFSWCSTTGRGSGGSLRLPEASPTLLIRTRPSCVTGWRHHGRAALSAMLGCEDSKSAAQRPLSVPPAPRGQLPARRRCAALLRHWSAAAAKWLAIRGTQAGRSQARHAGQGRASTRRGPDGQERPAGKGKTRACSQG
jgi:hypothetical protein